VGKISGTLSNANRGDTVNGRVNASRNRTDMRAANANAWC